MKPHPHRNSIQTPPPILPTCTSTRRFSIASIGTIPAILESIHTNATLFTQQLLLANVDAQTNRAPHSPSPKDILALPLDAEFASALLKAIRKAAGSNTDAYDDYFAQLREQELPSFVTAHACCGTVEGPAALRKREYFDFIAYIACRSLIMATPRDTQLSTDDAWQSDQLSEIQRAVGDAIMRHILDEIDVSDASASAISPLKPIENDALLSASPELDSTRGGVKALLQYFRRKGSDMGYIQHGLYTVHQSFFVCCTVYKSFILRTTCTYNNECITAIISYTSKIIMLPKHSITLQVSSRHLALLLLDRPMTRTSANLAGNKEIQPPSSIISPSQLI